MKPKTRDALLTRPYETRYRISQRVIAPNGAVVMAREDIWKKDIEDAEKAYEEIPTLALLVSAARSMDLKDVQVLTAEKSLTAHLFNVYGFELIENVEEISSASRSWRKAGEIFSESRSWKDLADLIEGKDDTDE